MDIECLISKQRDDTDQRQYSHPFVVLSNVIASNGILSLLEPLAKRVRLFDDYDWCKRYTKMYQSPYHPLEGAQPPLLLACERPLSNVLFIKLLIKTYGVNINIHALVKSPNKTTSS